MAIFIGTHLNNLGVVAGIRKDRKGLFTSLRTTAPFLFLKEENHGYEI